MLDLALDDFTLEASAASERIGRICFEVDPVNRVAVARWKPVLANAIDGVELTSDELATLRTAQTLLRRIADGLRDSHVGSDHA